MTAAELKSRTKRFAVSIMELADRLPASRSGNAVANQLVRSATSVGANYRAACRARSRAEFISKLCIVFEEADESLFWLELLEERRMASSEKLNPLTQEAIELTAIIAASLKTVRENKPSKKL